MRLLSPVFYKEMVGVSRRRWVFVARGLFLGLLLTIIYLSWTTLSEQSSNRYLYDFSYMGKELFEQFMHTQLIAILFLVPILTAPVVAMEKDRNMLSLLLMSNLSKHQILLDKLLSRLLLVGLFLFAGLPILMSLLSFGGVTPKMMLAAYLHLFGTIFLCTAIGILCSTTMAKVHTAMISTFTLMIGYVFTLFVLTEVLSLFDEDILEVLMPLRIKDLQNGWFFFFYALFLFGLSMSYCVSVLARVAAGRREPLLKRWSRELNAFFEKLDKTGVRIMEERKPVSGNGILWKEAHNHFYTGNTFLIRATYVLLAFSVLVLVFLPDLGEMMLVIACVCVIMTMLIAAASSSTTFTSEREKHSLEVLLTTPLTARELVLAKFLGVLKLLLPTLIVLILWVGLGDLLESIAWHYTFTEMRLFPLVASLLAFVPMVIVIGLHAGLVRKRSGAAMLQTLLIVFAWSLLPVFTDVLDDMGVIDVGGEGEDLIFSICPVSGLFSAFDEYMDFHWLAPLVLIGLWMALLALLILGFDRKVGRQ